MACPPDGNAIERLRQLFAKVCWDFGAQLIALPLGPPSFVSEPEMTGDKEGQELNSQIVMPKTEAAILARIIQSEKSDLTPEVARYLLSMKLPSSDEKRVHGLSVKMRSGSLTDSEMQELETYLHIGSLLEVMRSKARRFLKSEPDFAASES